MFLIMIFILSKLQLPGQGCLPYRQSAKPCSESIEVGMADCAIKSDGAADDPGRGLTIGKQFDVEAGDLPQTNKHTEAGLNAESTKEKESRNGTDEKTNIYLDTNTTAVAQLVESSVKNLINDPEEKRHKKRGKKKRQRSMMKHNVIDKKSIKIHEHTITELLKEYNAHCGDESVQNVTYCESIFVLLEEEMRPPKDDRHRKTRHILEPNFLCWNIVPFRIKWYNPMTQICCDGIHDRISGDEICCGNNVVNETDTLGCCGMETYNTQTSLCCGDILYDKNNASLQCCGSKTYDSSAGLRCCNGQVIDSARQFCCDNNVLYDNIGKRNNHGGCCGRERYDTRCYSCNVTSRNPTIYPIFEPETQVCCEGRIKTTRQNKTECCGKRLIDPNVFKCVNGSSQLVPTVSVSYGITPTSVATGTSDTAVSMEKTLDTVEANFEESDSEKNDSLEDNAPSLLRIIFISLAGVVSGIVMIIASAVMCRKRCQKQSRYMNGEREISDIRVYIGESTSNVNILQVPLDTNDCDMTEPMNNDEVAPSSKSETIYPTTPKLMTDSSYLKKHSDTDLINLTTELSNDAETQTFANKRSNVRDTFGNIYQDSCYLDRFNRTLTWERSDCKMTLPESAVVNHKVEAYASSYDNLPSIYEKFSLPPETRLVSPVVEYRLPGMKVLDDFALVELPFIGKPDHIEVWKCPSDEGMYQTTECRSVPILERADINFDLWCLIEEGKVRVYTKSFSIFFCTCQEQPRNLCLRAFLFGSYKKILERKEVRLSLYIADELHTFKDYNQRMFELENLAERELKCDQEISLHKELDAQDYLEISMSMVENDQATWDHKLHPTKGIPLEDKHKNVYLSQVARCCNSLRSLPNQVSWYLENKPDTHPKDTVQCLVDINCCLVDERSPPINTSLYIDELQLRAKDRAHVLSEEDRAADLKDFLNHHLDEEGKTHLNEELKRRNKLRRHSGECQDLCKSLDCLYNDMYPAAFTRTVASVLDDIHFDKVIDQLEDRKCISKAHLRRSLQACAENSLNHTIQGFENRRLLPDRHVVAAVDHSQNLSVHQLRAPECRRELEETITTSYDHRAPNQQEREDIFATDESDENLTEEPLLEEPHLEDSDDESDTELKQIVTSL